MRNCLFQSINTTGRLLVNIWE